MAQERQGFGQRPLHFEGHGLGLFVVVNEIAKCPQVNRRMFVAWMEDAAPVGRLDRLLQHQQESNDAALARAVVSEQYGNGR
ncbi:MAG: hypothetical protein LAP87_07835 [Acidobacteriia bacterium]|nr:hypothetical protein [Terriglobia bacterium]